jgi:hypothetical protein
MIFSRGLICRAASCQEMPASSGRLRLAAQPWVAAKFKIPTASRRAGTLMRWRGPRNAALSSGRINNILWPNPERGHLLNAGTLMHVHDSRTPSSRCCGNFLYMTTPCTFRTMGLRAPKDQHGRGAAAQAPMQAWHNCNSRERQRVLPARKRRGPAPCSVAALGQLTCTRFSGFRSCACPSASSPRHYHPSPSRSARAQSAN